MTKSTATTERTSLPKAGIQDSLGVISEVFLPTVSKGLIIRRPKVVAMAERLGLDRRAVRRMQRIRDKYAPGPLLIHFPGQPRALILSPDHVHRVLDESPEPFATASSLKREALVHFEPKMALVSHGYKRAERRRFNEEVLDTGQAMHRLAETFLSIVSEEAEQLLAKTRHGEELTWDLFAATWFPMVRRIVLGDAARDDEELRELLDSLRSNANWAFLHPKQKELRERFHDRLQAHLARAEPGSLAGVMAATHTTEVTAPNHQAAQWLFAFDPAGINTFRTLALLASHPEHADRAREEIRGRNGTAQQELPYLRSCLLEGLRLWPTTPMVLRESTRETTWESGIMPAETSILIFAPLFHRDDQHLPYADRFEPEIWLENRTAEDWPLIPFSGGPGMCPGRNLVLLVGSAMLAELLAGRQVRLKPPTRLDPNQPLPATLNNYSLRFEVDG